MTSEKPTALTLNPSPSGRGKKQHTPILPLALRERGPGGEGQTPLTAQLESPYQGYAYAYPHKTAYRPFDPPLALRDLWQPEDRRALFLYIHLPFCEMRCGFCNLFTMTGADPDLITRYLATVQRQVARVKAAIAPATFARFALGGGTPTLLEPAALDHLLRIVHDELGADLSAIPVSVETSPRTATPDRLRVLRDHGVDRISIGVQSFDAAEVRAMGRAQSTTQVRAALDHIRAADFPTLNLDLIYGAAGQTVASWQASLRAALDYAPEELYLYPLYVRPLTGLGQHPRAWDDQRLALYRAGRDLLRDAGYTQVSMRMFCAPHEALTPTDLRSATPSPSGRGGNDSCQEPNTDYSGTVYCCQEDGMIGLGCGARSYTQAVHYSTEYAVGRAGIRDILRDYIERPDAAFDVADFGVVLDFADQCRRYVIKSLLRVEGLSTDAFRQRFGVDVFAALPELADLRENGLAELQPDRLCLTAAGLQYSDVIGPWLYSDRVKDLIAAYTLR